MPPTDVSKLDADDLLQDTLERAAAKWALWQPERGQGTRAEALRAWVNAQVGKTQRLSALRWVDELPRSAIGKVLKRELRDGWAATPA
mgnify:CR=1 FL=1